MDLSLFLDLLEKELIDNQEIAKYHRFVNSPYLYIYRKSYLAQRLQFVIDSVDKKGANILDLGCGFGTFSIFLALNGYRVHGITLEYYFDQIELRKKYWSQFGDLSQLTFEYQDLFNLDSQTHQYDYIVAIDTLHHIEPMPQGLNHLTQLLTPSGEVIISEENGNNLIAQMKHFKERGFKRISSYYDQRLKKEIQFGNENTRSLKKWLKLVEQTDLTLDHDSVNYIRCYFPWSYNKRGEANIVAREQKLWRKCSFMREYFFFGINFRLKK